MFRSAELCCAGFVNTNYDTKTYYLSEPIMPVLCLSRFDGAVETPFGRS
jgi:hypothetical protein